MKKSTVNVILVILKYILLITFSFIAALFVTDNLPNWLSPWWALVGYIVYCVDCIYLTFAIK